MPSSLPSPRPPRLWQRLVGMSAAAIVWILTLASVSPQVHADLHDDHDETQEHSCAVTLFAAGVESVGPIDVATLAFVPHEVVSLGRPDHPFSSASDHRQPPGRAPPRS